MVLVFLPELFQVRKRRSFDQRKLHFSIV